MEDIIKINDIEFEKDVNEKGKEFYRVWSPLAWKDDRFLYDKNDECAGFIMLDTDNVYRFFPFIEEAKDRAYGVNILSAVVDFLKQLSASEVNNYGK